MNRFFAFYLVVSGQDLNSLIVRFDYAIVFEIF